ncbi:MAG: hypothetical protein K8I27_13750 [Planctomycetes bacterium]|nr:hypothetical protein [Planctomycetota bacterium]
MKNLLLIAFATIALFMGANVANACPTCEGKEVVKTDKATDKADVNTDAVADAKEAGKTTAKTMVKSGCASAKKASAGQLVRADRDIDGSCKDASEGCCGGCCTKAKDGKGDCCGGCCNKKEGCGEGCGEGCNSAKKAEKAAKN